MNSKSLLLIAALAIIASACGPTGDQVASGDGIAAGPQTWLDAPLDGMVIPLAPYNLVFHSASTMLVSEFGISINGEMMAMVMPMNGEVNGNGAHNLYYGDYSWEPPAPGTYLVEVSAYADGEVSGNGASAMVRVMDIPEPEADEEPVGDSGAPMFDTAMFYYRGNCDPQQVTVDFIVADPDIFNVVMFMRLEDMNSGEKTEWTGVAMNAIGDDYYRRVVASSQIPDADMYKESYFQVQIVVTREDGSEILRTEVVYYQVMLIACGQAPPPVEPTIPPTTPTPTPIPPPK